jgi:hypothetical protein
VEAKQAKRAISTEPEAPVGQPDSKRAKVEPPVEKNISIANTPNAGPTEVHLSTENPSDIVPLDNVFKEEPHVFLKSDNAEIKKCMYVITLSNLGFFGERLLLALCQMRGKG